MFFVLLFFFFKQKTAYEVRISDWSSDVCSSDLACLSDGPQMVTKRGAEAAVLVPAAEWRRLHAAAKPSLKELLLADTARTECLVPPRGQIGRASCRERECQYV